MKKLIITCLLFLPIMSCYADDDTDTTQIIRVGTADQPMINGVPYDVHKPFIEPNPGYVVQTNNEDKSNASQSSSQQISGKQNISKVANNFQTDTWATDEKVEKALKKAASDGKLDYVLGQAKEKKLPATVAVVPIVESKYNTNAVSPKGAGGAWQIMPSTAAGYGVESKQRFDFESSTKLALTILSDLHEQFGNWQLAFAAYNCGSQCVINALKKNPTATSIDDLSVPSETKNYVHQIMQINSVLTRLSVNEK